MPDNHVTEGQFVEYIQEAATQMNKIDEKINQVEKITGFNQKGNVATYADLATIENPQLNDAYGVIADGLTYVYNGNSFPTEGNGMDLRIKPDGVVEEGNTQAVSGGEVYDKVPLKGSVGIYTISIGQNLISEYTPASVTDTSLWVSGYYHKTTGLPIDGSTGYRSLKLIKVKGGVNYDYNFRLRGDSGVCFYDEDLNFVQAISTNSTTSTAVSGNITLDNSIAYMGLTFYGGVITIFDHYFKPTSEYEEYTSDVFITNDTTGLNIIKDITNQEIEENLNYRAVEDTPIGTNFIQELVDSDINDKAIWSVGFLKDTGNIGIDTAWRYSVNYQRLRPGRYDYLQYFRGNAKMLIYDLNYNITQVFSNSVGELVTGSFVVTEDSYIRISFIPSVSEPSRISNIYVKNTEVLKTRIITEENYKSYLQDGNMVIRDTFLNTYSAKKKTPVVTFISDDGHIRDTEWYLPLLYEYGVRSTLAISKHWVEAAESGLDPNRLNRQQIIDLHKEGNDIANHTVNHYYLNQRTEEEIEYEIMKNKLYLEDLISDEVPMFVSPFGIRNPTIDKILSKYHDANFISGHGVRNQTPINNYFINRVSCDTRDNNVLLWESDLLPALNSCLANSEWLVFTTHPGYSTYAPGNPVYMEKRNELRQIIEFCQTNDIQIMTARRAYDYWKNHVNIGVRGADENYYQLGMDMTELNVNYFK